MPDTNKPAGSSPAPSTTTVLTSSPRQPRELVLVSAKDWQRRLSALERMNRAERDEFHRLRRLEISVEDLRDEIVGMVIAELGRGVEDTAFETCHANGGPHPGTLKRWADRTVHRPWTSKMRQAGLTVGMDLKWVRV